LITVKGGGYVLEVYIMFYFKTFVYNICPRFNDTFYRNGLFLTFIINV